MKTYFKESEFDSPDLKGSGSKMKPELLAKLNIARHNAGIPFKINSGYRTPKHNKKVGGASQSSHLKGLAVDIACNYSTDRFIIVNALLDAGINRIGIAKTFIHCDVDCDKHENVIWVY